MKILLASRSPRRHQLLADMGYEIKNVSLSVDETPLPGTAACDVAEQLARRKAAAYTATIHADEVLLAADTVVVCNNAVLGKPHDSTEAANMLRMLSGREHTVYTGVCLRTQHAEHHFTEATLVHFLPLTDDVINHYIATYRPYDKAGAYGIQDWIGMVGISGITGDYYNVMGLPTARLFALLHSLNPAT